MPHVDATLSNTMKVRILDSKESIADSIFSPNEYFLGLAQKAMQSRSNVRIALPGKGEAVLLPHHGECHSSISDMEEFCRAPAAHFDITPLATEEIASIRAQNTAKCIRQLLWEAGFHASQGRLVASCSCGEPIHEFNVIRFMQWPNLSRLSTTPNTMRVFALLTQRPSALMLVHRKLRIDREEFYQVYSAACSAGYVDIVSNHPEKQDDNTPVSTQPVKERGLLSSLFAKIAGL